jgi:hypothetical protein
MADPSRNQNGAVPQPLLWHKFAAVAILYMVMVALCGLLALVIAPGGGLAVLAASLVGGVTGGFRRLHKEGRLADAGGLLRDTLVGWLSVVVILFATLIGEQHYGPSGWRAGLLGSTTVVIGGVLLMSALLPRAPADPSTVPDTAAR